MRITMKDIAKLAGVSQQIVSSVLSGGNSGSRASKETREKVIRLARELNYIPNKSAISLKGGTTQTIGILGSINSGTVNSLLLGEISEILQTHAYQTISCNFNGTSSNYTWTLTELASRGVDGIIIGNSLNQADIISNLNLPYLFLSHSHENGYDVGIDDVYGGQLATNHLIEHGRKRIAFVSINVHRKIPRQQGWQTALMNAALPHDNSLMLDLRDDDGCSRSLIKKLTKIKIDAIFASNDYIAGKLMAILINHGIRVPDDIAIIGYDGYSFTEFCSVPLTTIVQPIHQQAEIGVELLLKRINEKILEAPFENIKIKPTLFAASSCGCNKNTLDHTFTINTFLALEEHFKINFGKNINLEKI